MRAGKMSRRLAAMTLLASVTAGCSPDPAPTPAPPPPVSQTPTESAQEMQQRVDYEAAEKAYRTFRAEYGRVLQRGGAEKATQVMTENAGGPYLREFAQVMRGYRRLGFHESGTLKIGYVRYAGYSTSSILLDVCEDDRPVDVYQRNGKKYGSGEVRTARLDVRKKGDRWKMWDGESQKVDSCD